jgi:N-acetylmuramoyl-L-alanine amidase
MLYNKLQSTGATVVMTRFDDRFLNLDERVQLSRGNKADLFISLHYNTNADASVSGSMTFYYDESGEDHRLANLVQEELTRSLKLDDLGTRYGDFYVLRENPQTAILVETAFLTNQGDEQAAQDPKAQDRAAEGIFRGIIRYFEEQTQKTS